MSLRIISELVRRPLLLRKRSSKPR